MNKKNKITENKTAILRGVGGYYGHVIKVDIVGFDEKENIIRVLLKNKEFMDFNMSNGWEHLEQKSYSTYQLDINHLKAFENESWIYRRLDNSIFKTSNFEDFLIVDILPVFNL